MQDQMTFTSKAEAQAEIAKMKGWRSIRAMRIEIVNTQTYKTELKWVICCNGNLWLRKDGFVR